MTIASLDSFFHTSIGPSFDDTVRGATSTTNNDSSKSVAAPANPIPSDSSQLSPVAQVLNTLQQVQQSDHAKYQQLTERIATNLTNAAQTAQQSGDSAQANQLTQLAADFTNASKTGDLPNIKDLAAAIEHPSTQAAAGGYIASGAQQLHESLLSIQIDFSETRSESTVQTKPSSATPSQSRPGGRIQTVHQQLQKSVLSIRISLSESSTNGASLGTQQSPYAQVLNALGQVRQADPAKYRQLLALVARSLQKAAETAESSGNAAEAGQLKELAADLTNASKSGDLPKTEDLRDAIGRSGGHRQRHFKAAAGDSYGSSGGSATEQTLHESALSYQINFSESSTDGKTTTQEAFSLSGSFVSIG